MRSLLDAQVALGKLGYYAGPPDGDAENLDFRADLRRFQADYPACGRADGVYGPRTDFVLGPVIDRLRSSAPPEIVSMRRWRLTTYYVGDAPVHGTAPAVPLYADGGELLDRVAAPAFVEASLEGSTRLADGRLIGVAGWRPVGGDEPTFKPVLEYARRQHWIPNKPGYAGLRLTADGRISEVRTFELRAHGAAGWPVLHGRELDPFRTVAADIGALERHDPQFRGRGGVVPLGTRVFVLELVDLQLPDGTRHDGWVTVADTGGGIFGAHFDLFVGVRMLLERVRRPAFLSSTGRIHVWFAGIEQRLPLHYAYGLEA